MGVGDLFGSESLVWKTCQEVKHLSENGTPLFLTTTRFQENTINYLGKQVLQILMRVAHRDNLVGDLLLARLPTHHLIAFTPYDFIVIPKYSMHNSWNPARMMKVAAPPSDVVMIGKKKAIKMFKTHIRMFATEVP